MNTRDDLINYLFDFFDEIINSYLSNEEKKEWDKCLRYYDVDLLQYLIIIKNNFNLSDENLINIFSYSDSIKNSSMLFKEELLKNVKRRNKNIEKNFETLWHKITMLSTLKAIDTLEKENIYHPDFEKKRNNISAIYSSFGFPRQLEISNFPSIRTFTYIETHKNKLNFTILRTQLIKENFLDKDSLDNDSFEIIFNKKVLNKNFKQINWLGSIKELKTFINYLFDKEIIIRDLNYYLTIIDCFLIKGTNIEFSQLKNPRGSSKRFEILENIISNSIIKF